MVPLSAPKTPRGSWRGWPASGGITLTRIPRQRRARTHGPRPECRVILPEASRPREEAMRRPGGIRRVKAPRQFRGYRMDRWRGRSMAARVAVLGVLASLLTALPVASSVTAPARAAASCPADGCAVTVDAHDFASGSALANFNFIVNLDNSKLPSDPLALNSESYTPIVAEGNQ